MPVRRESALSPLGEMFVGPEGLYPGARWLIYIAMGLVVLGVLNSVLAKSATAVRRIVVVDHGR